jgi:uncharacterized membrane protein YecN with MAPEG domain
MLENAPPLAPLLALQPVTIFALYAAANAALLLLLAVLTTRARRATGTSLGDGGNARMTQAVRAHGNAAEYIPIGLILLYTLTLVQAPTWLLHLHGAMLTLGRVFHALGLHASTGVSIGRFLGTILTWLSMAIAIAGVLYYAVGATF